MSSPESGFEALPPWALVSLVAMGLFVVLLAAIRLDVRWHWTPKSVAQQPAALRFSFLDGKGRMPMRMGSGAAGFDCYVRETTKVPRYSRVKVPLGFAVEIPKGYCGLIVLRSSASLTRNLSLAGGFGVIDSDYRGEVHAIFEGGRRGELLQAGERLVQLVIVRQDEHVIERVGQELLSKTERGEAGFGSTGTS